MTGVDSDIRAIIARCVRPRLDLEFDDFWLEHLTDHPDAGDSHGQLEAAPPGTTGVEVEDAVAHLTRRLVGVTADDGVDFGRCRIEVEGRDLVNDIEEGGLVLENFAAPEKPDLSDSRPSGEPG